MADYLRREKVPFSVATVPLFKDPLGITNDGVPTKALLPGSAVGRTLQALNREGLASIVLHGYTHQWDKGPNPYNMLTGDDFEFYRVTINADNSLNHIGPVPEDSALWAKGRIWAANGLLALSGLRAFAWEAPHYLASATDYQTIRTIYPVHYGRLTYFGAQRGASVLSIGQFFPYLIQKDAYGYRVVPESLGNIEPEPIAGYRTLYPEDLIRHAEKLRVVRDGIASFFYHPHLVPPESPFYLADVIQGLKKSGYQFVSAESMLKKDVSDSDKSDKDDKDKERPRLRWHNKGSIRRLNQLFWMPKSRYGRLGPVLFSVRRSRRRKGSRLFLEGMA
jgi:uncharacterized protein YdaL